MLDDDGRTPLPRVTDPPCRRCPKVPRSVVAERQRTGGRVTPDDAVEPGPEHRLAVAHFLEYAAVDFEDLPDDGWVRRHAALIRPLLRRVEQRPLREVADLLKLFLREASRG